MMELKSFPPDLLLMIMECLCCLDGEDSPQSAARMAQVCRLFYRVMQPKLNQLAVSYLFTQVNQGKGDVINKCLSVNPKLLLLKVAVGGVESGLMKHMTLYQYVLGLLDPKLLKITVSYFPKLPSHQYEKLRLAQYHEKFVNGLTHQPRYHFSRLVFAFDRSSLDEVSQQRHGQSNDRPLCLELQRLRRYFEGNAPGLGLQFHYHSFIEALEIFYQQEAASVWPLPKLRLFWFQVIGYIERFLPACDIESLHEKLNQFDLQDNRFGLFRQRKYYRLLGDIRPFVDENLGYTWAYPLTYNGQTCRGFIPQADVFLPIVKQLYDQKLELLYQHAGSDVYLSDNALKRTLKRVGGPLKKLFYSGGQL